jgi:hypothetical protein
MANYGVDVHAQRATVANNAAVSDSLFDKGHDLVALDVPALTTGTVKIGFDTTTDPPTTVDADATWKPVYGSDDALYVVTVAAATAARRQIPAGDLLRLGRFRLHLYASGGDQVQTGAKTIVPLFRMMR